MIETSTANKMRPCTEAWENMDGSAKVRYCHKCKRNVYNLDGLDTSEARAFVERIEGGTIGELSQREDGKYLVGEPVRLGVRAKTQFAMGVAVSIAMLLAMGGVEKAATRESQPVEIPIERTLPPAEHFGARERQVYEMNGGAVEISSLERIRRTEKRIAWRKQLAREGDRFEG